MIWKLWPALLFSSATIAALIYDGLRSVVMAGLWTYNLQQFWQAMSLLAILCLIACPWVKQLRIVSVAVLAMFAIAAINRTGIYISLSLMGFSYWHVPQLILIPMLFLVVTLTAAIGLLGHKNELVVGVFVIAIGIAPISYSEAKHMSLKASNTSLQPTSGRVAALLG